MQNQIWNLKFFKVFISEYKRFNLILQPDDSELFISQIANKLK